MTKEISINDLAVMIGKGFNSVDKKFEKLEGEMVTKKEFKEAMEKIDKHFKTIDNKLDNVVYRSEFEKLENKVKEIETVLVGAGIKV